MEGLKNYREKLKAIEKLVDKMENGLLTINELAELESLTRDLYERSVILKYKAFEGKVVKSEPKADVIVPIAETSEASTAGEKLEIVEKVPEIVAEIPEAPVLDFSLFDGSDDVEEEQPQIQTPTAVEAEIPVTPIVEIPEKSVEPEVVEYQRSPQSEPELSSDEPTVVVKEKGSSFLARLDIADNSISAQLAGRKIDTLQGVFGLNERLLYINQLFDGSGDAFSEAIKILDSQQNLDEASYKVEELAFANSWNPEEGVVLEFLAIIKRRYA